MDCVNIMAAQLKSNLNEWCLLFANALALLSDLISHQSNSACLWLWSPPWEQLNCPRGPWFFHPNIQPIQPLHIVVVVSLWGYRTVIEHLYLEVYQGPLYGGNYPCIYYSVIPMYLEKHIYVGKNPCWRTWMKYMWKYGYWCLHPSSASVFSFSRWR